MESSYNEHMDEMSKLIIVGTPIGNIEDISLRAMKILLEAEVIVCEDTRVTDRLLKQLEARADGGERRVEQNSLKHTLFRLDENVQLRMIPKIINWLETGTNVVLVTDAGMPTISDPGWRVIDAVRSTGFEVEVIPGPTALTTALAASGMDSSRVWFMGFPPKKSGNRQELWQEALRQLDAGISTAIVFYESPNRLLESLHEISRLTALRTRRISACGELTKLHEKVIRGTIEEVIENLPLEIKGEWVVVVGKS